MEKSRAFQIIHRSMKNREKASVVRKSIFISLNQRPKFKGLLGPGAKDFTRDTYAVG